MQKLNDEMNILIATHKMFTPPDNSIYIPIQVGTNANLGFLSENQMDNIANKNPHFCELTILYFMWKNIHSPIVGLVHYRRYFFMKNAAFKRKLSKIFAKLKWQKPFRHLAFAELLTRECVANKLAECDCILPEPEQFKMSAREQYQKYHHIKDLDTVRDIVAEKYPDYLSAFDAMQQRNYLHYGNMFIAKKTLIDAYCAWLFEILFEAEKRIDITQYNPYNQRVFGFLSERLFNVWVIHHQNDFRFTTLPVYQIKGIQAA